MTGFSEPEDAYAADAEGGGSTKVKRQRSMKNREFGLYAGRLRQRPPTKQDAASDVPWPTPRSHQQQPQNCDDSPFLGDAPQSAPLPLSLPSPRWASLTSGTNTTFFDQTAHSKPSSRATTSSSTSSRFAGLSSHPYIPEPPTPDRPEPPSRESATPEVQNDSAVVVASSPTRPESREAGASNMLVENFSRPRKPSVRQSPFDLPATRLRPLEPVQLEQSVSHSAWPRDRSRGLSLSSNKSVSTHASFSNRPSNDHLRSGRPVLGGGLGSPGLPKPQMAYSRVDNSASNATTGFHSGARDTPPWITDEELRSSYRSQLTASTAQGTLFTTSGTERSSVLTKTSSRTSVSLFPSAGLMPDEGLSVEDVMGMYEKGFYSTGAEDNDIDNHDDDDTGFAGQPTREGSVQEVSIPDASQISSRMLEAMGDPLPLPSRPLLIPLDGPHVVRDSGAFFRNSGLPASLPKDVGLGLASENIRARKEAQSRMAPLLIDKRDSAKMLDSDDRSPLRRQHSTNSARSVDSSASRSQPVTSDTSTTGPQTVSDGSPSPSQASMSPAPIPEEDPESRDRYGFRKKNQYITQEQYDAWNSTYSEYIDRRRRKWVAYLTDSGLLTDEPTRFPALYSQGHSARVARCRLVLLCSRSKHPGQASRRICCVSPEGRARRGKGN